VQAQPYHDEDRQQQKCDHPEQAGGQQRISQRGRSVACVCHLSDYAVGLPVTAPTLLAAAEAEAAKIERGVLVK
jgi:hypothetical protein